MTKPESWTTYPCSSSKKKHYIWTLFLRGFWVTVLSCSCVWQPSRKIWVPRTSRGRPHPTSPGCLLMILFNRPSKVPIWRPGDVLIWRSRDVPGRLIRDVPRTFTERPLVDLESTQTWISKNLFNFSFITYSIDQI